MNVYSKHSLCLPADSTQPTHAAIGLLALQPQAPVCSHMSGLQHICSLCCAAFNLQHTLRTPTTGTVLTAPCSEWTAMLTCVMPAHACNLVHQGFVGTHHQDRAVLCINTVWTDHLHEQALPCLATAACILGLIPEMSFASSTNDCL